MLAQQLVNGITSGGIYSLFGLGFTLVFGVLGILNLAHAGIFMIGGFVGYLVVANAGLPIYVALPLAMIGGGFLGIAVDLIAFRPLRARGAGEMAPMITSIGFATILTSVAEKLSKGFVYSYPVNTFPLKIFIVGSVRVTALDLTMLGSSIAIMFLLRYLMRNTKMGKATRSVAFSPRASRLLGINTERIFNFTFFVSGALAGAAGVFIGLATNVVSYTMGGPFLLKGFVIIIIGGLGNIEGAMVAGFMLGMIEALSAGYISTEFRDVISFALLILFLVVRPSGLFGAREEEQV